LQNFLIFFALLSSPFFVSLPTALNRFCPVPACFFCFFGARSPTYPRPPQKNLKQKKEKNKKFWLFAGFSLGSPLPPGEALALARHGGTARKGEGGGPRRVGWQR